MPATDAALSRAELDVLHADAWFNALPGPLRRDMLVAARRLRLQAGALLHRRGDTARGLYVLLSGAMRISGTSEQGGECTLAYIEPGTWFGEISLVDGAPRTHDACAVVDTDMLVVPEAQFKRLLAEHPQAGLMVARLLAAKLRATMVWMEDMALQPLACRLARRLLDLHARRTVGSAGDLTLSQDDLAALVGASRQSVNRELKAWSGQGWVSVRYGSLRILEPARLRELAGAGGVGASTG